MVSPIFSNKEVNLLHALRSRSTECKTNPKQKYIHTNLLCTLCETEADDQPHLMRCTEPFNKLNTEKMATGKNKYEDIFSSDVHKQRNHLTLSKLLKIKRRI